MADAECTTSTMDWTSIGSSFPEMGTANDSLGLSPTAHNRYKRDTELMVLITTTSIIGLVLNIAALAVLLQKRNIKTSTNHYLVLLAVGDIMLCTIVLPLRLVHVYNVFWWTRASCIIFVILKYTPMFLIMNTVVLIAIERCVAVVLPAKFAAFASPRNVKIQLGLVWMLALVELIYPFAVVKTTRQPVKNYCTIYHLKSSFIYMFTSMVAVPFAFLVIAYGTIIVTLVRRQWNSRGDVEMTPGNNEQAGPCRRRRNTRLIILCAIITVFAMLSWMPAYILMYVRKYYHVKTNRQIINKVVVVFYFHPVFNPIVYFFVDARFRAGFMRLFRCKTVGKDNISMASVTEVVVTHE